MPWRSRVGGVAAAAVCAALWPAGARAETTVSGAASGSVAPLVIAPSDDPAVERLDLGGGPADVFFVQRIRRRRWSRR